MIHRRSWREQPFTSLGWKTSWAHCRCQGGRANGQGSVCWLREFVVGSKTALSCHCRQSQTIPSEFNKATMPGGLTLGWFAPLVETTTDTGQGSKKERRYHKEGEDAEVGRQPDVHTAHRVGGPITGQSHGMAGKDADRVAGLHPRTAEPSSRRGERM